MLETLTLWNTKLKEDDFVFLFQTLKEKSALPKLNLIFDLDSDTQAKALTQYLRSSSGSLEVLELHQSDANLPEDSFSSALDVLHSLSNNTHLYSFTMDRCPHKATQSVLDFVSLNQTLIDSKSANLTQSFDQVLKRNRQNFQENCRKSLWPR
jgi:hypothetical protein